MSFRKGLLQEVMDRVKYWYFILLVVVVPIAWPAGQPGELRPFQEHFFQWMAIGFIALFIENIWLTLFLIYNVITYLWSGGVIGSLQVLNILFGCLIFRFSRSYFKKHEFSIIYKPILFVMCLSLIFFILQRFGVDPMNTPQDAAERYVSGPLTLPLGLFGIAFAHAIFLSMCVIIVASTYSYGWVFSLFLLFPIFICNSSGAILALISAVLFYSFYRFKRVFLLLVIILPILGGAYIWYDHKDDPLTMKSRFPLWSAIFKASFQRPEGYGPDSFRNVNAKKDFKFGGDLNYRVIIRKFMKDGSELATYYSPSNDSISVQKLNESLEKNGPPQNDKGEYILSMWDNPHNEYLNLLFQYGFPGVLLLFGLLREMFIRFKQSNKNIELLTISSCIIIFLVSSLVQFPFSLARLAVYFPILLGAFYSYTDTKES